MSVAVHYTCGFIIYPYCYVIGLTGVARQVLVHTTLQYIVVVTSDYRINLSMQPVVLIFHKKPEY